MLKSRISCRFWVKKSKNKNKTKLDDICLQFAHIHVWQGFYKSPGDKNSFPPEVKDAILKGGSNFESVAKNLHCDHSN